MLGVAIDMTTEERGVLFPVLMWRGNGADVIPVADGGELEIRGVRTVSKCKG